MILDFDTLVPALGLNGSAVALSEMQESEAQQLGALFATMTPWSVYPFNSDELSKYLATQNPGAPHYALRLASPKGEVIGALCLRESTWLHGPSVQFLGLSPAYQNKKIGAAVLSSVEQTARAASYNNLWVVASKFNKRALAFYQRFGFIPVASLDGLIRDDQTEILLRKRIEPKR